jgi:hypothetical protein
MDWLGLLTGEIDAYFQALAELGKQQRDIIAISVIIVGALFAAVGYRFFKYILGLAGFLLGAIFGLTTFYYLPWVNTTGEIGQLFVAAIFGAIGGLLFYAVFYYFGIFVFGAVGVMWLGLLYVPRFESIGEMRLLLVLGLGFMGGLLALVVRKQIVIILTAAIGSVLLVMGIGHFYNWPVSVTNFTISQSANGGLTETILTHNDGVVIVFLLCALTIAGLVVQLFTSRGAEGELKNARK